MKYKKFAAAVIACVMLSSVLTACGKISKDDKLVNEGIQLYKSGDYTEALNNLIEVDIKELKSVNADTLYYYLGESYFKTGDYEKSLEAHIKAVELDPELFRSWVTIGVCYRKLGDTKQALESYSKALLYDPMNGDSVGLYISLGAIYISNGKPFSAIEYLEKAAAIYPEHAAAHAYLAIAYAMAYENEKSEEELLLAEALGYNKLEEVRAQIDAVRQ